MSDGFVLVDKPATWTSHDVIGKLRRLFGLKRIGHAGTLDPAATGLLVVGLGKATRLLRFIQELPKVYVADVRLGEATDSGDADGEVIERCDDDVTEDALRSAAREFVGDIAQRPPQVSAIKRGGKRLHKLARQGVTVEVEPRQVVVHDIEIESIELPQLRMRVTCGKGTYIRVLADDIARRAGSCAHLTGLRRLASGSLSIDDAVTIDQLEGADDVWGHVLTAAVAMRDFPAVVVPPEQVHAARHGAAIDVEAPEGVVVALIDGEMVGLYRSDGHRLAPEVVLG